LRRFFDGFYSLKEQRQWSPAPEIEFFRIDYLPSNRLKKSDDLHM